MPYKPLDDSLFSPYRFDALVAFLTKVKGITLQDIILFLAYIIDSFGLFHFLKQFIELTLLANYTPESLWLFRVFAVIIGADPATVRVVNGEVHFKLASADVALIWKLLAPYLLNLEVAEQGSKAYSQITGLPEHICDILPLDSPLTVNSSPYVALAALVLLPVSERDSFNTLYKLSELRLALRRLSSLYKKPKALRKYIYIYS